MWRSRPMKKKQGAKSCLETCRSDPKWIQERRGRNQYPHDIIPGQGLQTTHRNPLPPPLPLPERNH